MRIVLLLFIGLTLAPSSDAYGALPEGDDKVRIFILAGQSNMEGKGFPEPLSYQVTDASYRDRYRHFIKDGDFDAFTATLEASRSKDPKNPVYSWSVRDDVWVKFLGKHGPLSVGFGVPHKCFGPEYNFGHVLGDHFDAPVLIIKTAWGGKSLGRDFLPPSATQPTDAEIETMVRERNAQIAKANERNRAKHQEKNPGREFKPRPSVTASQIRESYGRYYREMMKEIHETLQNLKTYVPTYRGQGFEFSGFVWFQGWNDQFNDEWGDDYGEHLAHFIRDVRRDLGAENMPFVVGQVGFDGKKEPKKGKDGKESNRTKIKRGQAAVASYPEFAGRVGVVRTEDYWDMDAEAIYHGEGGWKADVEKWQRFGNDRPYHYYGSPWFFAQAGTGFGEKMVQLLSSGAEAATVALFNGRNLSGWHVDVPKADDNPDIQPTFVVENGVLVSRGQPQGHLITNDSFSNYRLEIEYRWPAQPGNCGVLVHSSTPRRLYGMFPQSIECQMYVGNAGDFWCIGEDITVPNMEARRGPKDNWGVDEGRGRRIVNLTDGSEKEPGEWNEMVIECRGRTITVWVNGDKVNEGTDCTADHGQIALQAEGAVCEFRRVELTPFVR